MNNRVEYANVFLTFMSCSEMRSTLTLSDSESSSTRLMLLNSTRVEIDHIELVVDDLTHPIFGSHHQTDQHLPILKLSVNKSD